jgi:hypothetical protein
MFVPARGGGPRPGSAAASVRDTAPKVLDALAPGS